MMDTITTIIPNDHWLHAIDINTHTHPQASQRRPHCRYEACQLLSKEKELLRLQLKRLYFPEI